LVSSGSPANVAVSGRAHQRFPAPVSPATGAGVILPILCLARSRSSAWLGDNTACILAPHLVSDGAVFANTKSKNLAHILHDMQ